MEENVFMFVFACVPSRNILEQVILQFNDSMHDSYIPYEMRFIRVVSYYSSLTKRAHLCVLLSMYGKQFNVFPFLLQNVFLSLPFSLFFQQ